MKKHILISISVLLVIPLSITAQKDSINNHWIDEVVISASKRLEKIESVPMNIRVINRQQIENSSESALLPVLNQLPGIFATQRSITGFGILEGSAGDVNIRGVGQRNKVLMMFNGQPQWAGIFGHSLADTYVASDAERVEVVRGPASLLYGSNAMGGAINIITRSADQNGFHGAVRMMAGSYDTQKQMVNASYKHDGLNLYASFNHDQTSGIRPLSDFELLNGMFKAEYQISPFYVASGEVTFAQVDFQNPGAIDDPIFDNIIDMQRGSASVSFKNENKYNSGQIQLFYNWGRHIVNDGYRQGEQPQEKLFNSLDHNYGLLAYQVITPFKGNQITLGVDFKNWGGRAWGTTDIDTSVIELAGYALIQQELFGCLSLNAGLRYEHNYVFGGAWIPQGGVSYRPFRGNTIKALVSKGFRSPNIKELFMFIPQNSDLKPEEMLNYEVSVRQLFLNGKISAELSLFYIDGKNMIQTVRQTTPPPMFKNENVGAFKNKGMDFEIQYKPLKNLKVGGNYSYLHTDQELLAAPKHQYNLFLDYTPGRFSISLHNQGVYGLLIAKTTASSSAKYENYSLLNGRVAYRLGDQKLKANLFLKGENLTHVSYSTMSGYPMPGVVVMAGVELKF